MSSQENKEIVQRYFREVVNECRLEVGPEVLTPELQAHLEPRLRMRHKAVPDWEVTIEQQVAEGDLVVTIGTTRGTHEGEWFTPVGTLPPTNRHFAFTFTSTMRVMDGRISEIVWSNWDWLELLQQLEYVPRSVVGDE